jgi:hypothetical protein
MARDQINANFKAAIKKASRQADAALLKATTPEQKLIIMIHLILNQYVVIYLDQNI